MKEKHQEQDAYYKKIEEAINKEIHEQTNNREFTLTAGKAMEEHLKRVKVQKRLTTRWLKRFDIPNKDEIAEVAIKIVEWQEELDQLDETVHNIFIRQQENQKKLLQVRRLLEQLFKDLEKEVIFTRENKLKALEQDLIELKNLFKED